MRFFFILYVNFSFNSFYVKHFELPLCMKCAIVMQSPIHFREPVLLDRSAH